MGELFILGNNYMKKGVSVVEAPFGIFLKWEFFNHER